MLDDKTRRLWFLPGIEVVVFALIFWMSLLFMPQMMNSDGDLGRHLTIGHYILDSGQIPNADIFSHTMVGVRLIPHEWLSEIFFAWADRGAGLNGVAWLTAVVIAATYAVLTYGLHRILGIRAFVALAGGLVAAVTGALHTLTRPHIFTWLFLALFLIIIEQYRQNGRLRTLLPLPLLMVAWANIHGAFVVGLVLVGFYVVGFLLQQEWRQALLFVGLLFLLWLSAWINPDGYILVNHSFSYLQERFLVNTTIEYQSPDFHSISTWPFAGLILLSIVLGWRSPRQLDWVSLVLLCGWTAFALYSSRNIPLYALVAVVILAPMVEAWLDDYLPRVGDFLRRTDVPARLAWGWPWAIIVVVILMMIQAGGTPLDVWQQGHRFSPRVFPVAAIDSIETTLPSGPMFNEFMWGGYLLYRLWPDSPVFIDAQTDFYGEALTRTYLQTIQAAPGWEDTLDQYEVAWVIISPGQPLAAELANTGGWRLQYEDETAVIWVRQLE